LWLFYQQVRSNRLNNFSGNTPNPGPLKLWTMQAVLGEVARNFPTPNGSCQIMRFAPRAGNSYLWSKVKLSAANRPCDADVAIAVYHASDIGERRRFNVLHLETP
jgi:hypothetical protein